MNVQVNKLITNISSFVFKLIADISCCLFKPRLSYNCDS
jgi:hypothetical protein